MKTKYKLGTLVSFNTDEDTTHYNTITGVMVSADGIDYKVDDGTFINESHITNAYRPMAIRKAKRNTKNATTTPAKRTRKTKAESTLGL